ncbi:MAG: CopD family protein, partial [Acidimicrobiia bacterium]
GLWAGGILGLATLRPPSGWRGPEGRQLLGRFSPVAVPAFLATVGFGVLRAIQELASPADLVDSSYGRVLGLKVLGVAAMVPLSFRAWRRWAVPRREAGVAAAVIVAAGLLAAFPLPPRRANEAEAAPLAPVTSALPQAGDLTLAEGVGNLLVGLTLRPARPGPNDVLVYLIPAGGEKAAARLETKLVVGDEERPLTRCGSQCRRANVELRGGERLEVVFPQSGERATFELPLLPAPDGSELLQRLTARMHAFRTYRYDEVLRPAEPPVRARYAIVAPDRLRLELTSGFQSVRIGTLNYSRDAPQAPWRVQPGPAFDYLPTYIWEEKTRTAVHVVGEEQAEGVPLQVLTFFATTGSGSPLWYRLWVDPGGVVHRAEMRAAGHFMDHRYYDYDAPISIDPPVE